MQKNRNIVAICHNIFVSSHKKINTRQPIMEIINKIKDYIVDFFKLLYRYKYITVTAIFVLIMVLLSEHNLIEHVENKRKISELGQEIEALDKEIEDYKQKVEGLNNDVRVVEKVAREEYGMHGANEEVFIIETKTE